MPVGLSARTPAQIASEINAIKCRTDKIMLESCVQIGRCLTEAKEVLSHGEWENWLKESVSYSKRTANYLMQIYREYGLKPDSNVDFANPQPVADLSYTQAVILLGIPAEEREEFMACHDVKNMSKRQLQESVQEMKQNEEPVPLIRIVRKLKKLPPKSVQPTTATYAESLKYDEQFALHRDNMLSAYKELLKILAAQSKVDTARKEVNRKKALEIAANMVKTLREYPPSIITNMDIKTDNPG